METVERLITRSDAWTTQDDDRLAALVLQHIRTGSTQLRAFEEAANELGRTSAACGYRWNGVVRKHHREGIETAKRDRKTAQKHHVVQDLEPSTASTVTSSDSMKDVIHFLQTYDEQYQRMRQHLTMLEADRKQLELKVRSLESDILQAPKVDGGLTPEQLEADSKALFAIMQRARRLIVNDGQRAKLE